MKKRFRISLIALTCLVVAMGIGYLILDKPRPEGEKGKVAEDLADRILEFVNAEAWDSIHYLQWDFPGGYQFLWDKQRNFVEVKWHDNIVLLDLENEHAYLGDGILTKSSDVSKRKKLYKSALHKFWNDSFWLMAYTKIRDAGTTREYMRLENGEEGLIVNYSSGGATPGDTYMWICDPNGKPKAWRMWVKVIPIGGLKTTWEGWTELHNGAMVAPIHKNGIFTIEISDIKSGDTFKDLGLLEDPFMHIDPDKNPSGLIDREGILIR